MSPIEKLQVVLECQQAIHRFYTALDASDLDAVAGAIAKDGVWYRQGQVLKGPQQARADLAKRPAGRQTAHMVQNLVVDVESPTLASATYMTLVYRVDTTGEQSGPLPLDKPLAISENQERLVGDGNGNWLSIEKRGRRKFAS